MTIRSIQASLDRHIDPEETVLVALSGGVDSMVMLHTTKLLRPDLRVIAAHVNHGLREEATSDVELCQRTCEGLGVELRVLTADVGKIAREENIGLELAGRQVRHAFFENLRDQENCSAVLLGHHADDRVETLLHNLMRGTGIHGLAAMKQWSPFSRYLRPLLDLTKREIIGIAEENDIEWHEDHTNAESDFDRNWLRNDVVPMLETRRSGVRNSLLRTASAAEDISDYMRSQAKDLLAKNAFVHPDINKSTFFDVDTILEVHPALQAEVIQYIWTKLHGSGSGFSQKRINETIGWLGNESLKNGSSLYFGEGHRLCNRNGRIGAVTSINSMDRLLKDIGMLTDSDELILTKDVLKCR